MTREKRFSERYGYKTLSEDIILERITLELHNALCSCFDRLNAYMQEKTHSVVYYYGLQRYIWTRFLNNREAEYNFGNDIVVDFLINPEIEWYEKFDIVEEAMYYLTIAKFPIIKGAKFFDSLKDDLNSELERLNAGYRVVDRFITDIISEEEIYAVTTAIEDNDESVKTHIQNAVMLYSRRPEADYRNSIKESISAVEAFCRKKTGENTLGKALDHLEKDGIFMPQTLKVAFEKLYAYTNNGDTGIRHALVVGDSIPTNAEALFMLVSCSAFVNYLNMRM